ncbi:MAG: hypothetical protein JRD02_11105 [Deltaproteobacteria bacterium]|nr:hypothetical protein [Deltaproteobacteria bacterium]
MRKQTKLNDVSIAVLVWVCVLSLPLAAAPWGGSGTEDEPYRIADASDLESLASDPNYYDGYYFILTADIDLLGKDGRDYIIAPNTDGSDPYFNGTFDGNYHVIGNLNIDTLGGNDLFLGLFGVIDSDGLVQNLGLENATVTGGGSSNYVGVLTGASMGTIKQCYASGTVTGGLAVQNLGGMVGWNMSEIYNSYADVNVSGGASSSNIGGFVGQNGITDKCYASGMVSGGANVGGFAGSGPSPSYCYFLDPSDGGGPDNGLGFALLEGEMQDQASFATWDFFGEATNGTEEIWMMDNFPVLGWQIAVGMPELAMLSRYWRTSGCPSGNLCETVDWYRDGTIDTYDFFQLAQSWQEPVVAINLLEIGDDFETGDFGYMPWVMGGDANFVIVSDVVYQGSYAAKSGTIGDSQTSSMEFTVDTTGYEVIGFYMKTSTEADADKLKFYDNGDPHGLFYGSGELDWTYFSFNTGNGMHTFKWAYEKNGSGSSGDDCVWIDKIEFLDLY